MFQDRTDAAMQLSEALVHYKDSNALLLAIPRGGVPIAAIIGERLGLPVDILLTKKIGHPANRELAIGAVSSSGLLLDQRFDVPYAYVEQEAERIREMLREQEAYYRMGRGTLHLEGRPVILVDDGIATGFTIRAAIELVRKAKAAKVVVAVPVAARSTADQLRGIADEWICPSEPEMLRAIGAHYIDFGQVSDEEVVQWLAQAPSDPTPS